MQSLCAFRELLEKYLQKNETRRVPNEAEATGVKKPFCYNHTHTAPFGTALRCELLGGFSWRATIFPTSGKWSKQPMRLIAMGREPNRLSLP